MSLLSVIATDEGTLPQELRGKGQGVESVYVHVPFCSTKCHYCDFYSVAGHLDRADAFLDALEREMDLSVEFFGLPQPRTIFVGGGTPTLLSETQLARLMEMIRRHLQMTAVEEFTVEANPNTFDSGKAKVLANAGVNRMSFGAQSFNREELQVLQRDHEPASVAPAFAAARAAGIQNLNVDLIFGVPGQTLATWEDSLSRALELAPNHMSCYSLIYEPNTAMTARMRKGEFARIDEELELSMFEHVYRRLGAAGFRRYETSNYAHLAAECRHNLVYWKAGNWLGWGPSAGSHFALPSSAKPDAAAWQWKNTGSLAHYLEAFGEGRRGGGAGGISQLEQLSGSKWSAGAAVFWLRLDEGLNFQEFHARTGTQAESILRRVLRPFIEQGLAEINQTRARITERGVAVSDHILKRVLAAFEA